MSMYNQAMHVNAEIEGREMRQAINFMSDMRAIEKQVHERQFCREMEDAERRMARREYESWKREAVRDFLMRNILCLVAAAVLLILDLFNKIDFVTVVAGAAFIGVYLCVAFIVFVEKIYPSIVTVHEEDQE